MRRGLTAAQSRLSPDAWIPLAGGRMKRTRLRALIAAPAACPV